MQWQTTIVSFRGFRKMLFRRSGRETNQVKGYLRGCKVELTIATLLEERSDIYVESQEGGWIARVFIDYAHSSRPACYLVRVTPRSRANPRLRPSENDDPPWET